MLACMYELIDHKRGEVPLLRAQKGGSGPPSPRRQAAFAGATANKETSRQTMPTPEPKKLDWGTEHLVLRTTLSGQQPDLHLTRRLHRQWEPSAQTEAGGGPTKQGLLPHPAECRAEAGKGEAGQPTKPTSTRTAGL